MVTIQLLPITRHHQAVTIRLQTTRHQVIIIHLRAAAIPPQYTHLQHTQLLGHTPPLPSTLPLPTLGIPVLMIMLAQANQITGPLPVM